MTATRRQVLRAGGGMVAALRFPGIALAAGDVVEIAMGGRPDGSLVWFDPIGLHVRPGQRIRWVNRDVGNSHTATAYHPEIGSRPRRIPAAARPWNSGYLLPGESFSIVLSRQGVYDYYCLPHEVAGMVGRLVVGDAKVAAPGEGTSPGAADGLPDAALKAFPPVREIMRIGAVAPAR